MTVIENNNPTPFYRNACIVMIWCISVYSSIIQYLYFEIPNVMLMLGAAILVLYILAKGGTLVFRKALTEENSCLLSFMAYMLISGLLFSPYKNGHITQWITCMEYLFLQIVIASIIKDSGSDTFHILLLAEALALAAIFVQNPIEYKASGRYSIADDVNPNGLGMMFTVGIWAVLYRQQKSKLPLVLTGAFIALFGYCILLTGSRKSLIGTALAVVLWLFLCFFPSLKGKDSFLGVATILVMIILVFIIGRLFMSIYRDSSLAARMDNLLNEASEGKRSNMYREGYEILKTNPLFGIGFFGFQYYFGAYSHATLVEIPVSGGIIGVFLYFGAYYISIKKIIHIYIKTKGVQVLSTEHTRIKMVLILFVMVCFYTICIIHSYQFDSSILFGIIFGETAFLENRLYSKQDTPMKKKIGSKYIRYE